MINLLPTDKKAEIKAARNNIVLIRYIGIIIIAVLFLLSYLYISNHLLKSTLANANEIVASNDTKAGVYSDIKSQVDSLSQQLSGAKQIFDQEIKYSEILVRLGQAMPQGTILGELNLTEASFSGSPIVIQAYAKSTAETTQLQTQLQASSLFSQVELQSTGEGGTGEYPVSVSLAVVFNRNGV